MRLVREAKQRGENVRLVTGVDPVADGGTIVVAWHIPSTDLMVIEGIFSMAPDG